MLRRLRAFLVLSLVSIPVVAAAQDEAEELTDAQTADQPTSDEQEPTEARPAPVRATAPAVVAMPVAPPPVNVVAPPEGMLEGWHTEVHGYFRAPMALGISSRPNPDPTNPNNPPGPSKLQVSYGPNRVMDWSYYSFAYTRLQEQDWAELFIHEKKRHVDAVIGWMGYWYGAIGYRNPDASWLPGMAYLRLDTDFEIAGVTPNVALTMGAWWPRFGYFEKYDTYTLGRFRQLGEQVKLTVPLNPELTATLVEGFGTNRDGAYNFTLNNISPLYAGKTGVDLIAYVNLAVAYENYADIGLHYNYEFTRDPYLSGDASLDSGRAYSDASQAHLSVVGGEANIALPYAGRVWISPSFLSVKNGWALAGSGGTEVMHSQNGWDIAANYMAWTGSTPDSTGSGSMVNLGFLYENTLSNVLGKVPGDLPEVTVSVFGLLANASLDLPGGTQITQNKIRQLKYGADVAVQASSWLELMLRGDTVNYDLDHAAYIFSAITARLTLASHYLSGERVYLQYSRYIYGDKMVLAAKWPWNTPLVAGTQVTQAVGYSGKTPDENVIKLQAQIAF